MTRLTAQHAIRVRMPQRRELPVAAALVVVALVSFAAEQWTAGSLDASRQLNNQLIIGTERVLSSMKDVETGQRGFLLTGDESYLEPYRDAVGALQGQMDALAQVGLPLEDLPALVASRLDKAAGGIAIRRAQGLDAAASAVTNGGGKQLMDAIRVKVASIQAAAQSRIAKQARRARLQDRWLIAAALIGLAGAAASVIVFARRRRHEARILVKRNLESESRFRTLAEHSAAIIWTTSAKGRFNDGQTQWQAFTGQTNEETSESGWANAIHPDDREQTLGSWSRAVAARMPYVTEHRMRRADGEWRNMAVQGVPVFGEHGELREWVGTHTDITERRHAEDALAAAKEAAEAANRSKSAFLANMSHELRTPLSAVIGYSEMLGEEMEDLGQPHLLVDLKKIETNARHLLRLINDVLDLSKIEANKMTSFAENFEVAALVKEAAATVESVVRKKGNTLRVELADDLGSMHSDVVKLRQCLFNLVSNAAKFTENGLITLSVRRDGGWLDFKVSDEGIGMTEEQVGRLFRRFEQADESTTRNFGGTGLGLALTQAFCRLLGGDVTAQSQLGLGTTFTLRLPASMPDQLADESDVPFTPADAAGTGKLVVLVVDDDESQRELLTRFLEREGFAVHTASDGRTGLEMAKAIRPRAILLDVMMPQMDGWSVLTALKADPDVSGIPVVMASFVYEPAMANALGAADYVQKPVEWDHLKSVMDRFRASGGSVLVVDDDADARHRLRTVLEKQHWIVAEASNGEEALKSVEAAPPQLILLDLTMPVMDGFTFLHELRARPGGAEIPVVVLSARDLSKGDRERLSGADRVLRKGDVDLRDLPGQLAGLRSPQGLG